MNDETLLNERDNLLNERDNLLNERDNVIERISILENGILRSCNKFFVKDLIEFKLYCRLRPIFDLAFPARNYTHLLQRSLGLSEYYQFVI